MKTRQTAFAAWLGRAGESARAYAERRGLYRNTLYFLAGADRTRPTRDISIMALEVVSADTGIAPGKLVEDALRMRKKDPKQKAREAVAKVLRRPNESTEAAQARAEQVLREMGRRGLDVVPKGEADAAE